MHNARGIANALAKTSLWHRADTQSPGITRNCMIGAPPLVNFLYRSAPNNITTRVNRYFVDGRESTYRGIHNLCRCHRRNENQQAKAVTQRFLH
jgi:hypothetical protein